MKHTRTLLSVMIFISLLSVPAKAQETVVIDASKKGEAVSPYIYGQFIEHLGRCIYGGIWAEMLEDRKFYDMPGTQGSPWSVHCLKGRFEMDAENPFVGVHTPKFTLGDSQPSRIALTQGNLRFKPNTKYVGHVWLKCSEGIEHIDISLTASNDFPAKSISYVASAPKSVPVKVGDYYKHEFEFEKPGTEGCFQISVSGTGTVHIGCVSLMPGDNVQGMRADTLALLKELDSPVYRWPGGNFVSGYDWNDGVGDRDRRPPRKNPAWRGIEHNDFGLDEFMLFCRLLNTAPYIAVNSGNGEVENALAELEYTNGSSDSPQGKRRAANGHADPYGVKFWGIGNEMYGNWQIGHMPVEDYAKKNNAFAEAFRKFDPNLVLVAVGNVGKWDEVIMRKCADHMDLISEHFYIGDPGKRTVPEHVENVPRTIRNIAEAHRKYRADFPELKGKDIRIAMDEWNYWYGPHVFGELGTRYFVRDGLGIAAGLHEYFRNSDVYFMANYAQTVNVIGCIKTSATNAEWETTGLVLKLYRRHFGTKPLEVASPQPLDVAAALTEDGKFMTIGIVNPTEKEVDLTIKCGDAAVGEILQRFEIVGKSPLDFNDPDQPRKIDIVESKTTTAPGQPVTVPAYSVTLLKTAVAVPD
ncbi:MAG TPA: alpha-N-arabinofuranosidase [Planctomycetaceae bacterium]|nr:alpha-N-arabinofuranosidase [Planctomycetaceae bacterium]